VLSIVDSRSFKRLSYQVLDHDATQADVLAFFQRFRAVLEACGLLLRALSIMAGRNPTELAPLGSSP